RPEQFPRLRKKLEEVGINGLTVSEVAGCGQQRGKQALFRGTSYEIKLLPKVKVEMVIESESVDEIIKSKAHVRQIRSATEKSLSFQLKTRSESGQGNQERKRLSKTTDSLLLSFSRYFKKG
ncbi:P-II family nitrogen regulator, partial [Bacillus licheniformis]